MLVVIYVIYGYCLYFILLFVFYYITFARKSGKPYNGFSKHQNKTNGDEAFEKTAITCIVWLLLKNYIPIHCYVFHSVIAPTRVSTPLNNFPPLFKSSPLNRENATTPRFSSPPPWIQKILQLTTPTHGKGTFFEVMF